VAAFHRSVFAERGDRAGRNQQRYDGDPKPKCLQAQRGLLALLFYITGLFRVRCKPVKEKHFGGEDDRARRLRGRGG
jgi:hypothetical protein